LPQSNLKSSLIEVEELEQQIQGHDPDLVMVAVMPSGLEAEALAPRKPPPD